MEYLYYIQYIYRFPIWEFNTYDKYYPSPPPQIQEECLALEYTPSPPKNSISIYLSNLFLSYLI